ncbi:MAG: cysteine desulfurase family protein [Pseudomonadota bacterium]
MASTTRASGLVVAMLPYFCDHFGNPHTQDHERGWNAHEAIESARGHIAKLVGAQARDVIFTSGATEANNIILQGAAHFRRQHDARRHLVTLVSEHSAVLQVCKALEKQGFCVDIINVGHDGIVDLQALASVLRSDTAIVSAMLVNNEIGVIQPLGEIATLCQDHDIWLHSDAAQAAARIPISITGMAVQFLSLSGHKIYGPMGIGAAIAAKGYLQKLTPMVFGGGQEMAIRPGTVPLALAVGFGKAASLCADEMAQDTAHVRQCTEIFLDILKSKIDMVRINGCQKRRAPGNLHLTLLGTDHDVFFGHLQGIALSAGSACMGAGVRSHVLEAIGIDAREAGANFRIGFGRDNTIQDAKDAAELIVAAWKDCKEF